MISRNDLGGFTERCSKFPMAVPSTADKTLISLSFMFVAFSAFNNA